MARGPGTGREVHLTEGVTPGGVHYWYSPNTPDFGYLTNSILSQRYPMSYIYGLASHTPTGQSTWQTSAGVDVQAAALGAKIAVIYGTDRVPGSVFFGPWAGGFSGSSGILTVGFGLGEGENDSLLKVETANGVTVNASPGASFTGFGGNASFHFYTGVDAPAAMDPFFSNVSAAYSSFFDERYPGLSYVSALLQFEPTLLNSFPDLRWTVKGRKLLDPRLGVDSNGIPNQPPVWSDNAMLVTVDYFINFYYGLGTPLSKINWTKVATIANWCDDIQADGRKRFTINTTLSVEASHKANIDFLRSHFRCTYAKVHGKINFYVDAPASVVKVFDEDDRKITNATNATPIVLTIPGHLRMTGDSVLIRGVKGNTAANGRRTVTVIDADTLSLDGSAGNGSYETGGAIVANCRPLHRWRTRSDTIPTKVDYKWTDPARDYQPASAKAPEGSPSTIVYVRTATYNGDGCRNAGQGQSQANYLLKKRTKDLNHSIVCNRAEGLTSEMYDVCRLNLPSFGITGYYARILRPTKLGTGEFIFEFEEYDSNVYGEMIAGTQSRPPITLPNPDAVPPTPPAPVLTQEGFNVRVDFSPIAPPYPFEAKQVITVQQSGGFSAYTLGSEISGPLYINAITLGATYTVVSQVLSLAGKLSLPSTAAVIVPVPLSGMEIRDGIAFFLTNPSQDVPADVAGASPDLSLANGSVKVIAGSTEITSISTIGAATTTGCVGTVNVSNNNPVAGHPMGYYQITAMTSDTAALDIPVTVNATTVTLRFTLAKTKAGRGKALTVISDRQTISADGTGTITPSVQLTTFTAIKQNIQQVVQWSMTRTDGTVLDASLYLSGTTGDSVTMTAAAFETARASAKGVIVTASATEII